MTRSKVPPPLLIVNRGASRFAIVVLAALVMAAPGCVVPDSNYCSSSAQCHDPSRPVCDLLNHDCVSAGDGGHPCDRDNDCTSAALPRCDLTRFQCAPCNPTDQNSNNPDGTNSDCSTLSQGGTGPSLPYCVGQGSTGLCVECRDDMDCQRIDYPVCNTATNSCRGCRAHQECGPNVLCDDGTRCGGATGSLVCVAAADAADRPDLMNPPLVAGSCAADGSSGRIVYVDSSSVTCSDVNPGTTLTQPLCTIAAGVTQADGALRPYVRILGGPYTGPVNIPSTNAALILVGAAAPGFIGIVQVSGAGTVFQVSGASTHVVLDSINIQETMTNQTVVGCMGGGALEMRACQVQGVTGPTDGATQPALLLEECDASLDRNYIGTLSSAATLGHAIGLLYVNLATPKSLLLQNNIIAGNMGTALDLSQAGQASVQFQFNTVVDNGKSQMAGTFGGIKCPSNATGMADSIIADNTQQGGTQFSGNCTFVQTVVGTAEPAAAGKIQTEPRLTANFLLDKTVRGTRADCCIDKIVPAAGLPDHDIDNTPRPQHVNWDIGANEATYP